MARESTASGRIKIQQKYNRYGKPMTWVVLPEKAVEWMGWQPGMFLTYYPTTAKELVLVPEDIILTHAAPDYDSECSRALVKERFKPRAGSTYERQVEIEQKNEETMDRLTQDKSVDEEDDDDDDFASAVLAEGTKRALGEDGDEDEDEDEEEATPKRARPRTPPRRRPLKKRRKK